MNVAMGNPRQHLTPQTPLHNCPVISCVHTSTAENSPAGVVLPSSLQYRHSGSKLKLRWMTSGEVRPEKHQ